MSRLQENGRYPDADAFLGNRGTAALLDVTIEVFKGHPDVPIETVSDSCLDAVICIPGEKVILIVALHGEHYGSLERMGMFPGGSGQLVVAAISGGGGGVVVV